MRKYTFKVPKSILLNVAEQVLSKNLTNRFKYAIIYILEC